MAKVKMKTKSALTKRIKKTATGKLKRKKAFMSHLAHGKTTKQKRQLAKATVVSKDDYKRVKNIV